MALSCASMAKVCTFGAATARPAARRTAVVSNAGKRELWYPGATPPSYLDGSMKGDYGFDPLRLGANSEALPWYREAELMNGRWAMAAVAGILFTDLVGLPKFWEAGAAEYALPFNTLAAIELAVMTVLEAKRYENFQKTGECSLLGFTPFDPMGMKSDETSVKELKNGRLAMLAFLGFCSQYAVRGMGPVECLKLHIADPWNNNIFTSGVGPEATVGVIALCTIPTIIEAKNTLDEDDDEFRPIPW